MLEPVHIRSAKNHILHIQVGVMLVAFLSSTSLVGCGGKGLDRVVVSGKVTLGGKPLADGEIRFVPIEGTKAPISGAAIVNGRYKAGAKGGVPLGTYKVEIEAYRPLSGAQPNKSSDDDMVGSGGAREQYIPARYNKNSELKITVPPESGALVSDFELVP